jgi:hypothetical protein
MPQKIAVCHLYRDGESDTDKKSPQLRLTVQEVIDRRQFMRCDWYLEAILGAMKKIGYSFRLNSIPAFCEKIGLSLRTFQRARRLLIDAGRLIETRINRDCIEFFLSTHDDKPIAQDDNAIAQDDKPIVQSDNAIAITAPKPAQHDTFENPSTLLTTPLSTPLSDHEGERDLKKPIPKSEEITPDYWNWLEAQALKMPRAIANIPVWIRSTAKKSAWMQTYADYKKAIEERKCSALSPSTNEYFQAVEPLSDAEISEAKAAILRARQSLKISAPAPSKYDRLPSIESFKSLGLGSV